MSPVSIAFLVLFIPGLVMIALVVAVALPRALRDEKARRRDTTEPVSDEPPVT